MPYHSDEDSNISFNSLCLRRREVLVSRTLICFWAVEYHLPHRVMRQLGKYQECPVEDIPMDVALHKIDRIKKRGVTNWEPEFRKEIDEWRRGGVDRHIHPIHQNSHFKVYLRWLHRNYRLSLRPAWTEADIAEDRDSDPEENFYDHAAWISDGACSCEG
uniref:Aminotransferase-like plant mobile domain-containing protein n=1 Tax=Leersia perrieri TaxID=77586 RepID=A0A0D9VVN9_9ORYZ